METRISHLFQSHGYLVRRSVPVTIRGIDTVTDIDTVGIKFIYPFQSHLVICDARDRVRSQATERVLWTAGVAKVVGASEAYVACRSATPTVVEFARQQHIRIMTGDVLAEFAGEGSINLAPAYSVASPSTSAAIEQLLKGAMGRDREAMQLLSQSNTAMLISDPYEDFNYCLEKLKAVNNIWSQIEENDGARTVVWKIIAAEWVVSLTLCFLHIVADSIFLAKPQRDRYIRERLTYGGVAPERIQTIFQSLESLYATTLRVSVEELRMRSRLPGQLPPPPYSDDVIGLVERARKYPVSYHSLPQAMDYLLFEVWILGRPWDHKGFVHRFGFDVDIDSTKAIRNILALIRSVTGLAIGGFGNRNGDAPKPPVAGESALF